MTDNALTGTLPDALIDASAEPLTETQTEQLTETQTEPLTETQSALDSTAETAGETPHDSLPGDTAGDETAVDDTADDEVAGALAEARRAHPLPQQLEALLLVADEPIGAVHLATAVDRPVREVRQALEALIADYDGDSGSEDGATRVQRGFELREVAGGYRFYVRESLDPIVADFVQQQSPTKLSQAALETLAVIAYRQPISRGAIASVRAVNVDSVVRTLVGRGLVTEVGHDPETGAILYGTDDTLLAHLGISSIDELPPIAPLLDDPSEGFEE